MIVRKTITVITLIFFIINIVGCYSLHPISGLPGQGVENLRKVFDQDPHKYKVVKVITLDGEVIDFEDELNECAAYVDGNFIKYQKEGKALNIPLSQVKILYIKKIDTAKTIFAVIGVPALPVIVILILMSFIRLSFPSHIHINL